MKTSVLTREEPRRFFVYQIYSEEGGSFYLMRDLDDKDGVRVGIDDLRRVIEDGDLHRLPATGGQAVYLLARHLTAFGHVMRPAAITLREVFVNEPTVHRFGGFGAGPAKGAF